MASQYSLMGLYYGYPLCCIEAFEQQNAPSIDQGLASQGTGFIPCPIHAKQIIDGKTNLIDLINNRVCDTPFPIDDMDVAYGPDYVRHRVNKFEHVMFPSKTKSELQPR